MPTYLQSLNSALRELLQTDPRVFVWGEDLLDPYGGAFKVTRGLQQDFPDRVLTTPISEAAIVGLGSDMALRGFLPVVEIMFGDFVTLAADQIINYAAKFGPMYNNQVTVPLVIRTPMGGGRGYGPTHSQSLEKIFFGTPNLHIVAPSIYHDPGDLLRIAVLRDDRPVLFLEHKRLYAAQLKSAGESHGDGLYPTQVVRGSPSGRADVTVIAYGGASLLVEELIDRMAAEEIGLLACFPGLVDPLPLDVILTCAAETGRVVILEEASGDFGWGAELAAQIQLALWGQLQAPVRRVAARNQVIPAARPLEQAVLPQASDLEQAIFDVML